MRIPETRYESLICDMLIPNIRHEGEGGKRMYESTHA